MDWTGCPAVNGIEPRNFVTLGSCPRFVHAGRQYRQPRQGERLLETRGPRPIRVTHDVNKATSEIPAALVRKDEYARQVEEAREANGGWEVGSLHSTVETW